MLKIWTSNCVFGIVRPKKSRKKKLIFGKMTKIWAFSTDKWNINAIMIGMNGNDLTRYKLNEFNV